MFFIDLLQLKGCPSEDVSKEVEDMIEVLGLEQKRKALSHTLSGGQKRKLSVGIALIAGSKVYLSAVEKEPYTVKFLSFQTYRSG